MREVALIVAGKRFTYWKSVTVTASLESACRTFQLGIKFPLTDTGRLPHIPAGAECVVTLGDQRILTGYAEIPEVSYDVGSLTQNVSGRSRSCDLVDSSGSGEQLKGVTLAQLAPLIAKQYGTDAIVDPTIIAEGKTLKHVHVKSTDKAYAAIEKPARLAGAVLCDDASGVLRIFRPKQSHPVGKLIVGVNVIAGQVKFDATQVFARYVCKGQLDPNITAPTGGYLGGVDDPVLGARIWRKLHITAESGADSDRCEYRAKWEAASRLAKAITASYTVSSWTNDNGKVWEPGQTVIVDDPIGGISETMLVSEVTFTCASDQAERTVLGLANPDTYDVITPIKRKKGSNTTGKHWAELDKGAK